MSYPLYLLSCCHGDSDGHLLNSTVSHDHLIFTDDITNICCIISSAVSMVGVLYLLLPRQNLDLTTPLIQSRLLTGPHLKSTVFSLFAADVLASAGVLIRSSVWLTGYPIPASSIFGELEQNTYAFCVAINLWIQYFYMCTYFWNVNFALELFRSVREWNKFKCPKYIIGWVTPALLCGVAGLVAYYPDLDSCYGTRNLEWTLLFLTTFIPIVIVIVVNPLLFWASARTIRKQLIMHAGKYTRVERELVDAIRLKLGLIVTVFLFCWLPNIIAAIIEGIPGDDPAFFDLLQDLWIVMAICNPLQALFNCLAYYGWPGWKMSFTSLAKKLGRKPAILSRKSGLFLSQSLKNEESSPIMTFRGHDSYVSYTSGSSKSS